MKSNNVTVNRMADVASENVANTVQEVVDEVAESHGGGDVDAVTEAVQVAWAAKAGEAAPPLPEHVAAEYAHHISRGNDLTVVPATDEPVTSPDEGEPGTD